jgi:hypothetical protein
MAELREMLRDLEGHVAALEKAGRQLADLLPVIAAAAGAVHEDARAVAQLKGVEVRNSGPWCAIENGHRRWITESEAEELRQSSKADLLLLVPRLMLRFVNRTGRRRAEPAWQSVSWARHKVLKVGMSRPGWPFGNRTVNAAFGGSLCSRSLTRYVADITALIQGGGTRGPYLWRISGVPDESDTGHGYYFDEHRDYLVLERNPRS